MRRWLNDAGGYGLVPIAIHWLSALTIFALFGLGWWMVGLDYYHDWYQRGPDLHRSVGMTLFALTVGRFVIRLVSPPPSALAETPKVERTIAHLVHLSFYGLTFALVVSGYLISTADGRGISVFELFEIPATITTIPEQEDRAGVVHYWLGVAIVTLAGLHGAAALRHHFVNKDETLRRMFGLNRRS